MMDFLQKLINEYKHTHSTTVNIIAGDDKIEEAILSDLKSEGYISFYSYKFLSDNDYWECHLTKKAIDKYAPDCQPPRVANQQKNNTAAQGHNLLFNIRCIAIIACITGVIMFIIGACTGTITGYKGADGLYYSDPRSVGSNEWLCMPGLILAVVGGFVAWVTKKS